DAVEFLLGHLKHRPVLMAPASIVDHDIEAAEVRNSFGDRRIDLGAPRHVRGNWNCRRAYPARNCLCALAVDIERGYLRASPREDARNLRSEARSRSCDDGGFIVETHGSLL